MLKRSRPVARVMEQIFESGSPQCAGELRSVGGGELLRREGVATNDPAGQEPTDRMVTAAIRARAIERRLIRELQQQRDLMLGSQERLQQAQADGDQQRLTEEHFHRCQLDREVQRLADQKAVAGSMARSLTHQLLMAELFQGQARCD